MYAFNSLNERSLSGHLSDHHYGLNISLQQWENQTELSKLEGLQAFSIPKLRVGRHWWMEVYNDGRHSYHYRLEYAF